MSETLEPDQAHLWYLRPEAVTDARLLLRYEGLLSEQERQQRNRFHFPEGRSQYLLTRALVRTALSRYTDVPPRSWHFTNNVHGRPEAVIPSMAPPLTFNVSHTKGFIACFVALHRDIGVDVENTERHGSLEEIAERHFSPLEARRLRALSSRARRIRFFEYWTLKESFIKALGVGISFGLSRFSFHLDEEPIRISFDREVREDPDRWQFALFHPGPHHVLAASLRREVDEEVGVRLREAVPLLGC